MKKILIVFHSQEAGNTKRMAELVARGCRQVRGVQVSMVNTNERRVDMRRLEELAKHMGWEKVAPSVTCQGRPKGEAIKKAVALGKSLAQHITSAK